MLHKTLVTAALSSLTTLALAAAFARESRRAPAEPVNAVGSHVGGDDGLHRGDATLRHTLPGALINFGGCLFWSGVMERWAEALPLRWSGDALFRGAMAATASYLIDYHGLPRSWRPGYEQKLSRGQLLGTYASLSVTLPLRAFLTRRRR